MSNVNFFIFQAFDYVDAPIQRVAQKEVPLPYNHTLEQLALPRVEDVIQAVKEAFGNDYGTCETIWFKELT